MASLSDLATFYASSAEPAGFSMARLGLSADATAKTARNLMGRTGRNYRERNLPDMLSNQGARGAFNTSATREKYRRQYEDTADSLTDLGDRAGMAQSQVTTNALLASTGIQI